MNMTKTFSKTGIYSRNQRRIYGREEAEVKSNDLHNIFC